VKTYREVLCPDCHRKYMTYVYSDEYDVIIESEVGSLYGWSDSCPKCSNNLFVEDNLFIDVFMINSFLQEDDFKI